MLSTADEAGSRNRKILYAVGGCVAVAAAAYLAKMYIFNNSGSSSSSSASNNSEKPKNGIIFSPAPENNTHKNSADQIASLSKEALEKRIGELRVEGSTFYGQRRFDHAVSCYQQCIDLADVCGTEAALKHKAAALSNCITCFNSQELWQAADFAATSLLETTLFDYLDQSIRHKAFVRQAKAKLNLGHFDAAEEACAKAQAEFDTSGDSALAAQLQKDLDILKKEISKAREKKEREAKKE